MREGRKRLLYTGCILSLAFIVLAIAAATSGLFDADTWTRIWDRISVEEFERLIESWGPWGVVAAIGLMVVHSFVPFPAEIVAFAAGMCFGPLVGVILVWTGAMLGAGVAFGLAGVFGQPRHWVFPLSCSLWRFTRSAWAPELGGDAVDIDSASACILAAPPAGVVRRCCRCAAGSRP